MYHEHYGLNAAPFKITPDTHLFFQGATRGDILGAIQYAILNGEGIIKVVGEVGSGKTMLCRMLEVQLPDNVEIVYLANPSLSPEDILHAIAFEMKLPVAPDANRLSVMQALQEALLNKHANHQQVVVFIEEAQRMPLDTLEEIRLLSNLETGQYKLLQMVMFGQPELDTNLAQESIRQLKERITQSFYLSPFDRGDIGDYLNYRMQHVGYRGPEVFSPPAIKVIGDVSKGLARRINILADKALMAAFADDIHVVSRKHALKAVADSEFTDRTSSTFNWFRPLAMTTLALATLLIGYQTFITKQKQPAIDKQVTQADPKKEPVTKAVDTSPIVDEVTTASASDIEVSQEAPVAIQEPSPVEQPGEATRQNVPVSTTSSISTEPVISALHPTPKVTINPGVNLTEARMAASSQWLKQAKAGHYSIQIMMLKDNEAHRALEKFLRRDDVQAYLDMVYIYRTNIKGQPMTGVVYGEYQNYKQAIEALKQLPDPMKKHGPHLRTVKGLRSDIRQMDMVLNL